jgi:hypothetical protein
MGAAIGTLKYAGYQYIVYAKGRTADRALSLQSPVNTVRAAANMHQAVIAAGYGRKGQRLHQFAFDQFRGAYRAGLKIAGRFLPCFAEFFAACPNYCPVFHEKAEPKRQQCDANNNKNQYL